MVVSNRCEEVVTMSSGPEWGASFEAASMNAMGFYDEIMVPRLFEPWAELILDELDPRKGEAALDVACGPGTVTRLVARRVGVSGRVTGCDFSPAMLQIARSKPTLVGSAPIDYLECPAEVLSAPDDDFDLVTCQQGLQFFPDRSAALAEMRRVLKPGGRLGISVWCDIEDCPPFAALAAAVGEVLGPDAADTYQAGPWGFGDRDSLALVINDSGFNAVNVRRCEKPLVFEGGPDQLLLTLHATAIATTLATLSEAGHVALAKAVAAAAAPITFEGVVRSYATSHVVTANAPE
jgi:SAM-dependent methyltransferase